MSKSLYLLDGMALVYRAHFALIRSPIFTSTGRNTSALFGFTNTLLDIVTRQDPTHLAIVFDSPGETERHRLFPAYKAQREDMPEDIADALPEIERLAEAFRIPVIKAPGYEADDIIGTLARRAEAEGFETFMVTPDKDFGQLVTDRIRIYKPGRQGAEAEVLGPDEITARWQIERPVQVIDILGLMGDASDNIPGVPGFGEKTAMKLIGQYGSIENLIAHLDELKGKQKERLAEHGEQALLSKRLATIQLDVPLEIEPEDLVRAAFDEDSLRSLFVEFEFNTLGRRLFGDEFKAGHGYVRPKETAEPIAAAPRQEEQGLLFADLKTIADVKPDYRMVSTAEERRDLIAELGRQRAFCFDTETDRLDPREARLLGIAFSFAKGKGVYAAAPTDPSDLAAYLEEFAPVLRDPSILKIGHNLKFDLSVLRWQGLEVEGPFFDTMIAHFLIDPERRHGMDALAEQYLGYSPVPITALIGADKQQQLSLADVATEKVAEYSAEDADVTWQLHELLQPELKRTGQDRVFHDIEMPLLRALVDMEYEGIAIDLGALGMISSELSKTIASLEQQIQELAGVAFNVNSPKQLGEVLFDRLQIVGKAKKTKTGQYATNEQVLASLAGEHPIIDIILEYREAAKLKSTYVDALPAAVYARSGRVHTTFSQTGAATGRLASSNPNLQNIPIRSELGQLIRRAFVPRGPGYALLSADYSQIELRIMAEMSGDPGLREAFAAGHDIHTATAARVYGVALGAVEPEMRRRAKMVNFGIIYGISAFGLSQRLRIPRGEAAEIIEEYFRQYPGVKRFMESTVDQARSRGYVETLSGRRRYLRDIASSNATVRAAAERMAINAPIQGTAADLIKLAMNRIHTELAEGGWKTRMLLQVHDELVFDLYEAEREALLPRIERAMKEALPMQVPIVVEMGMGANWLAAH